MQSARAPALGARCFFHDLHRHNREYLVQYATKEEKDISCKREI
jgi:hypothetical protein